MRKVEAAVDDLVGTAARQPEPQAWLLEVVGAALLVAAEGNKRRPETKDTPRRFAAFWQAFLNYNDDNRDAVFPSIHTDQMVVVRDMRVWSLCEHHMLPFWCDVSVGYIAQDKVLGLSKFARIAHHHAHKLQVQERLVDEIAREVLEAVGSDSVAVLARWEHLCMTMRGIRTPALMVSSAMHGVFRREAAVRAEFLALAGAHLPGA